MLNWSSLRNSEQSECRNLNFQPLKSLVVGWGGGLFDYSVKPGPDLSRLRLSLVQLVTRSIKARFGQVGDQVSQVKDQVGQGQGQELDNFTTIYSIN